MVGMVITHVDVDMFFCFILVRRSSCASTMSGEQTSYRRIQNQTKGGFGLTPGNLLMLTKPNPYPKSASIPAQKLRRTPHR